MQITKEKVLERIGQLEAAVRKMEGALDQHYGALQDARYWLAQLDADVAKEEVAHGDHSD